MDNEGLIGERIRSARRRRGLTQGKLAWMLGMTRGPLADWESGRRDPPVQRLAQLEDLLGPLSDQDGLDEGAVVDDNALTNDPTAFALELHLEDFLIENWPRTELGRSYDLFEAEDGQGRQIGTDTGPLDILAVSKDKSELLVIELKRGRASDAVVGQLLRYMGYVKDRVADVGQQVRGMIIAFEDDHRIRRALSMTPDIDFYRYSVNFTLIKS